MEKLFPAYTGNEPYVFVCYAHEDREIIYPEMDWLRQQGTNLWYDEGILAGKNWRASIGDALLGASHVLFYISGQSLKSDHCNREINLALDKGKDIVPIYLEEVELTSDLMVGLNRVQALHRDQDASYQQHLINALGQSISILASQGITKTEDSGKGFPLRQITWRNALTGGVLAFALLGFVGTGWVMFGGGLGTGEAPESVEQSVAVLPFVNMSGNSANEYFSDGITEELLNALSQLPGLRVPARTSSFAFKGQNIPIGQIAEALGVAYVLEGSVRRDGERVLITAQLVDARTDSHLWSETFERELDDIFAIQREIATAIIDQLRVSLSVDQRARLVGEATESTGAYEAYLRGRYLWSQRTGESLRNAIAQFERAIELDPDYAEAYSGLADSYVLLDVYDPNPGVLDYRANYRRALVAAQRAVSLAPELATARASLGIVLGSMGSWERGEEELDSAIRLNPGLATAHQRYGMHLASVGRGGEGVPYAERALELDPLSRGISYNLGNVYRLAGMHEQAIEQLRATTELDPDWLTGWFNLSTELLEAGRYEEGLEAWKVTLRLGDYDARLGTEAYQAAIRYQETGEAASFDDFDTGPFQLLWLYSRSGQPARAIDWFEELIGQGAYLVAAQLHVMFVADAVGEDPRYQALLAEAGITW